ncbi:hypothetical protein [uncultured Draconibacterium sp.]|uniref:hypothetical protein n=1 Tax=uncultured Draconibacterium sp. TaxID=1573823 RepID=UPI0025E35EF7|nr:hypothetical protein [uncultured Draconibacterium sp.]
MSNNDLLIKNRERKSLSLGARIYQIIFGLLVIYFCERNYTAEWIPLMSIGFVSIVYGAVGKVPYKTRNSIAITQSQIIIKRSFERTVKINIKETQRISLELYDLQVDFTNYAKSYDLSWLSKKEHQKLKESLSNVS